MAKITIKQAREIAKEKNITIRGNGKEMNLLSWYELTPKEQKEFTSYLDTDEKQTDATFFRYRNWCYDLGEIMRVQSYAPEYLQCFDGFMSDTFFSGVGIILSSDNDRVQCYTVIC